jgi:hypothetical protein
VSVTRAAPPECPGVGGSPISGGTVRVAGSRVAVEGGVDGQAIALPRRAQDRPDPERLARRFAEFGEAAA